MSDARVITPTVGREVWFWASGSKRLAAQCGDAMVQPEAAKVCYVWGDRCVNLEVKDPNGTARSVTSVSLLQPDDPYDASTGAHCAWMPYQVGQAKSDLQSRVEVLEAHVRELIALTRPL